MMDALFSDSDWESFSESSSSEEHEENDFLYGGQATSILSSLQESIGKIDDFLSFDRGFTHGDIVCSVTDPSGQMGRVININMLVDLENVHGYIIKDVNSKNILKIRSISVGDYVVLGAWLGRVDKVIDSVNIVLDDGSKCEVTAMDHEKLLSISPNLLEDSQYQYYPGQRVKVRRSTVKSVSWLCGTGRENHVEGTVFRVDAGLVYVDWLASALMGSDLNLAAPPRLQDSKNLTLLSGFSHANWQLGDWCMLPTADHKVVMEPTFINSSTCGNKKLERGLQRRSPSSSLAEVFVIVKTKTKLDVAWQDGNRSVGLDSQALLPISVVNSHEFWPDQFVLEKGISDDPHIPSGQRWGFVQGVDAKERTVTVQWRAKANSDSDANQSEASAYELVEHPDFSYCYGDVVFKLIQNEFGMCKEAALAGTSSDWEQNDCPDTHYSSCIGIVTGFKDGAVEVRWATGFTTKVGPNEIYGVEKYEGSATNPGTDEGNIEELNQEMHDKQNSSQRGENFPSFDGFGEVCKKYPWESSYFSLPCAAIGFFTSIATSLFGHLGSTLQSDSVSSGHIPEDANENEILLEKEVFEANNICCEPHLSELQTLRKTNLIQEVEEDPGKEELKAFTACENSEDQFRHFDMVSDSSDHHFLGASKGLALSQVKRAWVKKVQQEWSILEKTLPETIYVRIYEDRMDLIRAAIIGAKGTPYHDGLFFFDIFLPPEYPYEPPLVHYISGGLRVNPNLYESGKVCLSLLNTWTGSGTEVWNPGSSTILQVLLSLQALVLNEKPYFNEAGYDKQIGKAEGEKNSVSYNENAFLVTCKSMLYLLHRPPKHFKELVEEHFSQRSKSILLACKAYMEGAAVGTASGCKENGENSQGCSMGFKIMLAKLFPKLVEAFSSKGIHCSQFIEPEN